MALIEAGSADRRYHARVPTLSAFRALRFDAARTDLSAVLAPPYDIIGPAQRAALLEQDAHNIVRIELPADLGSATEHDYAAAASTLDAWRRDGVLALDPEPRVTVHRMRWRDAQGAQRSATGVLARLRLEAFGPGSGVRAHERTMGGPKEDRLRLLEATRTNTSPIVLLSGADTSVVAGPLAELTDRSADRFARTGDGVDHELWIVAAAAAERLLAALSSAPLTIADGHHRYETALAYREIRRREGDAGGHGAEGGHIAENAPAGATTAAVASRATTEGAWDHVLALVYPLDQSPPALPTHRVVRGRPCGDDLLERLTTWVEVERLAGAEALLACMAEPAPYAEGGTGTGRLGLLTADRAAILHLDRQMTDTWLPQGLSEASRGLDVWALSALVERAYGDEPASLAADGRLWYVKDPRVAVRQVVDEAASGAWLLDGMPPEAITAVAAAGEVMPHKSTYFDPKAPTGLVLSPVE
jgi:uncharacterized protein (DUF1015 family)